MGVDIFFFFYLYIVDIKGRNLMLLKTANLLYLTIISIFDLRTGRIPNFLTLGFFAAIFLSDIFTIPSKIPNHLLSAIFFFIIFLITALTTKGLGLGDVKLAAFMGYASGLFKTSIILFFACISGITAFLVIKALKKEHKKLPFAPFVTAGYIICEVFCRRIT